MKTKFKVGDSVRIVRNVVNGLLFKSGDTGTIKEIQHSDEVIYYRIKQNKPYRHGDGFWWANEDALCLADSDLSHDQFKSPLDGSWCAIEFEETLKFWQAEQQCLEGHQWFVLRCRTKRGLLNTLHRMNIQTRKCKSNGKDGK